MIVLADALLAANQEIEALRTEQGQYRKAQADRPQSQGRSQQTSEHLIRGKFSTCSANPEISLRPIRFGPAR